MKAALRQPVVQFVLAGTALFALFVMTTGSPDAGEEVVVSAAQIERLVSLFGRQWQRPPTAEELDALIEQQIREEVLYREALAMGLDRNDSVVRQRLAQKLEFLSQDLIDENPSEAELRAFFDARPERFAEPVRLSFRHVYLNPDRRGDALQADAADLLASLRAGTAGPVENLGDTFLLPLEFSDRRQDEIAGLFGEPFADEVSALPIGNWQGPVGSGYGLHVVLLEERVDARIPEFGAIRDQVRTEFLVERRRTAEEDVYRELRARYTIEIADWPARTADGDPR
jgi:hypothetical protein